MVISCKRLVLLTSHYTFDIFCCLRVVYNRLTASNGIVFKTINLSSRPFDYRKIYRSLLQSLSREDVAEVVDVTSSENKVIFSFFGFTNFKNILNVYYLISPVKSLVKCKSVKN